MNCSDKAFFVPWHSCVETEAPNGGGERSRSQAGEHGQLSYHSAWLLTRMNSEKHQHTVFGHYLEDTVSTLLFTTSASLTCTAQTI